MVYSMVLSLPCVICVVLCLLLKLLYKPRSQGSLTLIEKLLSESNGQILKPNGFGWTPLHYAAHFGEVKLINQYLQTPNLEIAYQSDNKKMTALHIAARDGQAEVVSTLIKYYPDLCESIDDKSRTALHVAVESKKTSVVEVLVRKKGFNNLMNERDIEGNTALHLAAASGHYAIVELLTGDHRVDKGALNNNGMTALGAVLSNTKLNAYSKAIIISMLQMRGVQPSLGRVVLRNRRISEQIHVEKGFKGILEVPASVDLEAEGPSEEDRNNLNNTSTVDQINHIAQVNLIVATIICSLTFTAAMAMPGGFGSSDGMASLRRKDAFRIFLIFDSVAFGLAASSMLLHFMIGFMSMVDSDMKNKYPFDCVAWLTILSIVSTVLAFYFGTNSVLWNDYGDSPFPGVITAVCFLVPLLYFYITNSLRLLQEFYFPAIYMK